MPDRVAEWRFLFLIATLFAIVGTPVHTDHPGDTGCAAITTVTPDGAPPGGTAPVSKPPQADGTAILAATVPDGHLDPAGPADDRDEPLPPGRCPHITPRPA